MNFEPNTDATQQSPPQSPPALWSLNGADFVGRGGLGESEVRFDARAYTACPELAWLRRVLLADPVMNVYALADLDPRYAPVCQWFGAEKEDRAAVVLLYRGLEPPILLASGPDHLVAETLVHVELPPRIYMNVEEPVYEVLQRYYDFGGDVRPMVRMTLASPTISDADRRQGGMTSPWWALDHAAAVARHGLRLVRLTTADAPRIATLYAHGGPFTPDAFADYQLADGVFFGVEDAHANLVATGGTHVLDRTHQLVAIGNMYTQSQWRGRGLAKTVLGAIVAELRSQDIVHIVLNVDLRNNVARSLYERMGFRVHCEYVEGRGQRHSSV